MLFFFYLVGQSLDPSGVTMLDSLKVYAKTKEAFGWPDDPQEEIPSTPGLGSAAAVDTETEIIDSVPPMTAVDKYGNTFCLGGHNGRLHTHTQMLIVRGTFFSTINGRELLTSFRLGFDTVGRHPQT